MMRDSIKDIEYFNRSIKLYKDFIHKGIKSLKSGEVVESQILRYKKMLFDYYFFVLVAGYSIGNDKKKITLDFSECLNYLPDAWDSYLVRVKKEKGNLNQYYLDTYFQMLSMLSLGYLLDIPENEFNKLVNIIDRDGVKDFLFEFIIKAKIKDRPEISQESYQEFFDIPKIYEKLRQAIKETDKSNAEKLLKGFIAKDWYKKHKDSAWYDTHKSKHEAYYGYWSFETAAVVKIIGLDDNNFKDYIYYPKDLV